MAHNLSMEHITVYRDNTEYAIIPWLLKLGGGELIVSFRQAHARRREHRSHTDPTARGVVIRSRDDGRTWGDKTVVDDETYRFSQTEDVPVTQLSDGTLLLNLYSWSISPLPVGFEPFKGGRSSAYFQGLYQQETFPWVPTLEGLSLLRSTDRGKTWSRRQPLRLPGYPPMTARCPALELPDGSLMLAVAFRKTPELPYSAWVIHSSDKGETWGQPVLVAEDSDGRMMLCESGSVRLKGDKIILLHRTGGYLHQSESRDNGHTWSAVGETPMWGFPAHLLELNDGRLLCTYGHRREPFGVRACISHDAGESWDIENEIVLRDDGGNADLGYPSSVEFPDGRVLTIYWFNQENKEEDPQTDTRYIAGSFYKP